MVDTKEQCDCWMSGAESAAYCKTCNAESIEKYEKAQYAKSDAGRIESLTAQLKEALPYKDIWQEELRITRNLQDDIAFIKRWVRRVHDKETTLEEFYGILRYYEPLKPVEAALKQEE